MGSRTTHAPGRPAARGALVLAALVLLGPTAIAASSPAGAATRKHSGNVNVLYAASLQQIMEASIGPAFHKATGYTFTGFSGASGTLANQIKGHISVGDVFISANTATNATLQGPANGSWVNTFVVFGNSPLVIGYNPNGPFASSIKHMAWESWITQPGIRIGRTDPATDPKGKLTVQAVTAAEQIVTNPALPAVIGSSGNIYPEQSLVGLLQSGQLDGGFFYSSEARAAHIPTVKLGRLAGSFAATYTIALLANAPNGAAAAAFMAFLVGPEGHRLLKRNGVTVVKPRVVGQSGDLPSSVRTALKKTS